MTLISTPKSTNARRSAAAQKAAQTKKARYGEDYFKALGSKGGKQTVAQNGTHWMSAIGYAGALTTCERHYEGDMLLMMARLRARKGTQSVWNEEQGRWVVATAEEAAAARDLAISNIIAFATGKLN